MEIFGIVEMFEIAGINHFRIFVVISRNFRISGSLKKIRLSLYFFLISVFLVIVLNNFNLFLIKKIASLIFSVKMFEIVGIVGIVEFKNVRNFRISGLQFAELSAILEFFKKFNFFKSF